MCSHWKCSFFFPILCLKAVHLKVLGYHILHLHIEAKETVRLTEESALKFLCSHDIALISTYGLGF